MAIKSALMTTAYDAHGVSPTSADSIFAQGSGHMDPNKAADVGEWHVCCHL